MKLYSGSYLNLLTELKSINRRSKTIINALGEFEVEHGKRIAKKFGRDESYVIGLLWRRRKSKENGFPFVLNRLKFIADRIENPELAKVLDEIPDIPF